MNTDKTYVGETNTNSQGLCMQIINYVNSNDIDVKFSDGYIKYHTSYARFKRGVLENPLAKSPVWRFDRRPEMWQIRRLYKGKRYEFTSSTPGDVGRNKVIIKYLRWCRDALGEFNDQSYKLPVEDNDQDPKSLRKIQQFDITSDYYDLTSRIFTSDGIEITVFNNGGESSLNVEFETGYKIISSLNVIDRGMLYHPFPYSNNEYLGSMVIDSLAYLCKSVIFPIGIKKREPKYSVQDQRWRIRVVRDGKSYSFSSHIPGIIGKSEVISDYIKWCNPDESIQFAIIGNFYCHCTKCGYKDIATISEMKKHKCIEN